MASRVLALLLLLPLAYAASLEDIRVACLDIPECTRILYAQNTTLYVHLASTNYARATDIVGSGATPAAYAVALAMLESAERRCTGEAELVLDIHTGSTHCVCKHGSYCATCPSTNTGIFVLIIMTISLMAPFTWNLIQAANSVATDSAKTRK